MKKYFVLLLSVVTLHVTAQYTVSLEDMADFSVEVGKFTKTISQDSLNLYFAKHLNEYRESNGLSPSTYDPNLDTLSKDQAAYCLEKDILTHYQDNSQKFSAHTRAKYFGYPNEINGECGQHSTSMTLSMLEQKIETSNKYNNLYDYLALSFVEGWKSSPKHDEIIKFEFNTYFSVSISFSNGKYYAFVVFSNGLPRLD